jgi:hypothetical protein
VVIKREENPPPQLGGPNNLLKMATVQKQSRQRRVLESLEKQLKSGLRSEKIDGKTTGNKVPLTEQDVKRIKKEIEILSKSVK